MLSSQLPQPAIVRPAHSVAWGRPGVALRPCALPQQLRVGASIRPGREPTQHRPRATPSFFDWSIPRARDYVRVAPGGASVKNEREGFRADRLACAYQRPEIHGPAMVAES